MGSPTDREVQGDGAVVVVRARESLAHGEGSVTERLLYIPVPAPRCMQDVHRGEVAPWGMCGHREGHSKAWPAYTHAGLWLESNLFVTLPCRVG